MDDMMKNVSPARVAMACLGCMAVWMFAPEIANAAVAFGEIGENVAENAKGIAKGVQYGGFAGGVTMGVMGIADLYKTAKNPNGQHSYQAGIIKVAAGGLLLGLGAFLGSGSATLFGSDQTSGLGDLGL